MHRRAFIKYGLATLSAAELPSVALAYPDRPIRLVVPFSPGGATDVVRAQPDGHAWRTEKQPGARR